MSPAILRINPPDHVYTIDKRHDRDAEVLIETHRSHRDPTRSNTEVSELILFQVTMNVGKTQPQGTYCNYMMLINLPRALALASTLVNIKYTIPVSPRGRPAPVRIS